MNALTPVERNRWSPLGLAFACVYVPLCVCAYSVELLVAELRVMRANAMETAQLTLFCSHSEFNAMDGIGCMSMCLSTLVAAPAFGNRGLDVASRRHCVANGGLAVPIFITYFTNRYLIVLAAFWSVTIIGSAIFLAVHFLRPGSKNAS